MARLVARVGDRGHRVRRTRFTGPFRRVVLPGVGHNPPQEDPEAFAEAVLTLRA